MKSLKTIQQRKWVEKVNNIIIVLIYVLKKGKQIAFSKQKNKHIYILPYPLA